ncbi:hypothetical protein CEXT_803971 [Caerostris extrusa]|uniref:Uncharacterized protein n=1 Tax=Caerostris extrusa TaxID=172846 RepID=A0AAV4Y307_CAEEX|nr:hypothetical protein CEXT_803971 [Caerostris extrusa]
MVPVHSNHLWNGQLSQTNRSCALPRKRGRLSPPTTSVAPQWQGGGQEALPLTVLRAPRLKIRCPLWSSFRFRQTECVYPEGGWLEPSRTSCAIRLVQMGQVDLLGFEEY